MTLERARALAVPDVYLDRPLTVSPAALSAQAGVAFAVVVARFRDADPTAAVGRYASTIDWGDGSAPEPGTVLVDPSGGFRVVGSHTYAAAGTYAGHVVVVDTTRGPSGRRGLAASIAAVGTSPTPPVATGLKVVGFHAVNGPAGSRTRVVVTFDHPLNTARARLPRSCVIMAARTLQDGRVVLRRVPVAAVRYRPGSQTVTVVLAGRLDPARLASLRLRTTNPRGLTDVAGRPITDVLGRVADFVAPFKQDVPPSRAASLTAREYPTGPVNLMPSSWRARRHP